MMALADHLAHLPDLPRALCAGDALPDLWFPPGDNPPPAAWAEPRRICRECPERDACLAWALETGEGSGMYGGLSPRERARLKVRAS